jgi:hypothetical protein
MYFWGYFLRLLRTNKDSEYCFEPIDNCENTRMYFDSYCDFDAFLLTCTSTQNYASLGEQDLRENRFLLYVGVFASVSPPKGLSSCASVSINNMLSISLTIVTKQSSKIGINKRLILFLKGSNLFDVMSHSDGNLERNRNKRY